MISLDIELGNYPTSANGQEACQIYKVPETTRRYE